MDFWLNSSGQIIINSSGLAILCDTCPCVPPPVECCLYPADNYGTESDLPATVVLTYDLAIGLVLTRVDSTFGPSAVGNYDYQIVDFGDVWQIEYRIDGGSWVPLDNPTCLITPGVVEDQFPDTFVAEYGGRDPNDIVRLTICLWYGTGTTPPPGEVPYNISLEYGSYTGEPTKWGITVETDGTIYDYGYKDGNQDSPAGTYIMDSTATLTIT